MTFLIETYVNIFLDKTNNKRYLVDFEKLEIGLIKGIKYIVHDLIESICIYFWYTLLTHF